MTANTWQNRIIGHGTEAPDQLLANPRNWRIHPKAQQDALSGLLDSVGWVQDVIVNQRTGHVVDGHLRVSLAISRQEPSIPVVYVDLALEEEALVLASLDPLAAMAITDEEMLTSLLVDVEAEGALADMLGALVKRDPKDGLTDPDAVPEVPEVPTTKQGDLWLLGEHRLMCGDSTDQADVERLMAGEKAVLLATDPPYLVDYDGGERAATKGNKGKTAKHWDDYHDPKTSVEFFKKYLRAALPHLAPKTPVYQWHATIRQHLVIRAWEECGLHLHQAIIWVKPRAVLTRSHYMWMHEPCFYGWVEGQQPERKPPANAKTVWEIGGENDGLHPTQKPVEVFLRPIEYHTDIGDVVLEPFSGSGTQIIAAEKLSRRCFAMEQEPRYVDVAVRRWEEFTGHKAECVKSVSKTQNAEVVA